MTPEEITREWSMSAHLSKGYVTKAEWAMLESAIAAAIQAERAPLENLLCRIHRDGGHYLHAHGLEKACRDADEIVAKLNAEHDTAKAERDARSQYIPSIKELTPQPWGVTVQMLPGGAFLLNPTETEERVRVAYLKATEAEVEAARKVIEPLSVGVVCDNCRKPEEEHVRGTYCHLGDPNADEFTPDLFTLRRHCRAAKEWMDAHTLSAATTTNEGEK